MFIIVRVWMRVGGIPGTDHGPIRIREMHQGCWCCQSAPGQWGRRATGSQACSLGLNWALKALHTHLTPTYLYQPPSLRPLKAVPMPCTPLHHQHPALLPRRPPAASPAYAKSPTRLHSRLNHTHITSPPHSQSHHLPCRVPPLPHTALARLQHIPAVGPGPQRPGLNRC